MGAPKMPPISGVCVCERERTDYIEKKKKKAEDLDKS